MNQPAMSDIEASALVPLAEAAAVLRVHRETLARWVRAGRVPAYGPRLAVRVRVAEVLEALRHRRGVPLHPAA